MIRISILKAFLYTSMLMLAVSSVAVAGVATGTVANSAHHTETIDGTSISMRSIPVDFDAQTPKPIRRIKHHEHPFVVDEAYIEEMRQQGQLAGQAIARQDPAAEPSKSTDMPNEPCRSYQGVVSTGWNPPDPHAAVGTDHVVVVVNSSIAVFDKLSGSPLYQVTSQSFFAPANPPSTFIFDPKVVYDPFEDRFIILYLCTDDVSKSSYLLAVSKTGDAMGGWWLYNLNAAMVGDTPDDLWPDYPGLGFDYADAVYVTSNDWGFSNGFQWSKVRILKKAELYDGTLTGWHDFWEMRYHDFDVAFTVKPAVTLSDAGGEYLLSNIWYGASYTTFWKITGAGGDDPTIALQPQVGLSASYTPPPKPDQPRTSALLEPIGPMTQEVMFRNDRLYTTFSQSFNWGSGYVASIRLIGIDVLSATAALNEIYGADGVHYFFPAIATDHLDRIYVVFSKSGSEDYPGIAYVDDYESDNTSHPLRPGDDYFGSSGNVRWGDYGGISVDPSQRSIWMFHEWATSNHSWSTWVGQAPGALNLPTPTLPADSSLVPLPDITLEWYDDQIADEYVIQIDDDPLFSSIDVNDTVPETSYDVSGYVSGYPQYWRLKGVNDCGITPFTEPWAFIPCGTQHGDLDYSSAVDIDDVVYLISYIFSGGPAPDPDWTGDANCDTTADIDDVVYLVQYIFSGGPEPCGACE
jgi:hypothetical protein